MQDKTSQYIFAWGICSSVLLILTPLFELRYFTVPWVLLALEINRYKSNENKDVKDKEAAKSFKLNIAYFISINCAVLHAFTMRPFIN